MKSKALVSFNPDTSEVMRSRMQLALEGAGFEVERNDWTDSMKVYDTET